MESIKPLTSSGGTFEAIISSALRCKADQERETSEGNDCFCGNSCSVDETTGKAATVV